MTQQINRRTVTKGIAWSVPAVAIASAAPAFASSGPKPTLSFLGACKYPGNNCGGEVKHAYGFRFQVTNNDPNRTIYFCGAELDNVSDPTLAGKLVWKNPGGSCIAVPPGETGTLNFFFSGDNSANRNFTADLVVHWGHQCDCQNDPNNHAPITIRVQVLGTPPGGACDCNADFL